MKFGKYGLSITTFEHYDNKTVPVLTHTFWGQDLDSAVGNAQAHMTTDYFFSSSFLGEMPWHKASLILSNSGVILGKVDKGIFVEDIMEHLEGLAKKSQQENIHFIESIER